MILTFDNAEHGEDTCRAANTDAGGQYESEGKGGGLRSCSGM